MVTWGKPTSDSLEGKAGPFVIRLSRKGDGRWDWKIFADGADSPLAAGVSVSVGASKTKCEQFVARSGRV
ncbi:MAG: hypothetical protein U0270_16375 [Labilithrix sp.]